MNFTCCPTFLKTKVLVFRLNIKAIIMGTKVAKTKDQKSKAVEIQLGKQLTDNIFPINILFEKVALGNSNRPDTKPDKTE